TPRDTLADSIKTVKEQLRSVPGKGLGYGVLKYLMGARFDGLAQPAVTFNYLGQFDGSFGEGARFVPAAEAAGSTRGPQGPLGNTLEINGQVYDGVLRLDWSYSGAVYDAVTVAGLAAAYEAELAALIDHCLSDEAGGLTSADVPLAQLSQAQLDALPL